MNNEDWYDKEVAPELMRIAKKCQDKGVSIIAVVEYADDERGITKAISENSGLAMIMLGHLAKMGTNIDGFMIGIMKYAREHGIDTDSSMFLQRMNDAT